MAEFKIPINFGDYYWLAKEPLMIVKRYVQLYKGKQPILNRYSCDTHEEWLNAVQNFQSFASFLNKSQGVDIIAKYQYDLMQTEDFKAICMSLHGRDVRFERNGDLVRTSFVYPDFNIPIVLNGVQITCKNASLDFKTGEYVVRGEDRNYNIREFKVNLDLHTANVIRILMRASYLENLVWVTRFMNFGTSFGPDKLEDYFSQKVLTK